MASFDANIDLEVVVRTKQLDKLEKRLEKINKFTVTGASNKEYFDTKNAIAYNQELDGILQRLAKIAKFNNQFVGRRVGPQRGNANQYPGQIGPGQASKVALQSKVEVKINRELERRKRLREAEEASQRQIAQAAQDTQKVQSALNKLDERGVSALEEKLNVQRRITNQLKLQEQAAKRAQLQGQSRRIPQPLRSAGSMGFPVALPETKQDRKLRAAAEQKAALAAQTQRLKVASKINFATKLELQLAQKLVGVEKLITKEQQKQISAGQALQKQKDRALKSAKNQRAAGKGGNRGGNNFGGVGAAIGFPLLFGGGAGSIAGGLLGSAGGFGGQILGSALGGKLDAFTASIAKLGKALDPVTPDVDALIKASGLLNTETAFLIGSVEKLGNAEKAQSLAAEQLAIVVGDKGVKALKDFGSAATELGNEVSKAFTALSAALAPILTDIAQFLASQFEKTRVTGKATRQTLTGIKVRDEFKDSEELQNAVNKFNRDSSVENEKNLQQIILKVVKEREQAEEKITNQKIRQVSLLAQLGQFRQQENQLLNREFELLKLNNQEDRFTRSTLEAKLKVDRERLNVNKAIAGIDKAIRTKNVQKFVAANKEFISASDALERAKVEAQIAEQAERVFAAYDGQAKALQRVNTISKMRLAVEKATLSARSTIQSAIYGAQLKINELEMQRAKRAEDINKIRQLEIQRAELIFQQTISQLRAELERVKLKARQVQLATKELQVRNLLKQAENKLSEADKAAMRVQQQALQIAIANIRVTAAAVGYQEQGARATRIAAIESANFAYQQNQAAAATAKTAAAAERLSRATQSASNGSVSGGSAQYTDDGIKLYGPDNSYAQGSQPGSFMYMSSARALKKAGVLNQYAQGGFVTRPTNAMIGEGGENEYVVPESKMQSSMARYARGMRGSAVTEGGSTEGGGGASRGTTVSINTGPVMRMNNKDYVTVSDLNSAVGSMAAAMSGNTSGSGYGGQARVS